jgi:hypothetical protein
MKSQPPLPDRRLKTLILVCLAIISSVRFFLSPIPALQAQATSKTPTPTSKPGSTASKPVKQSAVQSSKSGSKSKKVASRTKKRRKPPVRGQRTIESARVVEIQNALAAAGYFKTQPNGEWDDSTSKAMSAYQQDNGFRTTGKPDALSLKKLGL